MAVAEIRRTGTDRLTDLRPRQKSTTTLDVPGTGGIISKKTPAARPLAGPLFNAKAAGAGARSIRGTSKKKCGAFAFPSPKRGRLIDAEDDPNSNLAEAASQDPEWMAAGKTSAGLAVFRFPAKSLTFSG